MTANLNGTTPAYILSEGGTVLLNEAGQAVNAQYLALKSQYDGLNRSWCEAQLAALFVRHPWLAAITLRVSKSWEYDDAGGYYFSGCCRVENVAIEASCEPLEAYRDDGTLDLDLAASGLEVELDHKAPDLALLLLGEDASEERELSFEREALLSRFRLPSTGEAPAPAEHSEQSGPR